jgi:hypothetical protein
MSGQQLEKAVLRWLCCHIYNLYMDVCSVNTTYVQPSDLCRLMQHSVGHLQTRLADQDNAPFLWSRSFITVFTTAHHLSVSWATWIQASPYHLHLYESSSPRSGSFRSHLHITILYVFLIVPSLLHALPISLLLDHPEKMWPARKADNFTALCELTV